VGLAGFGIEIATIEPLPMGVIPCRQRIWQGVYKFSVRIGVCQCRFVQSFRRIARNSLRRGGREFVWPGQAIFVGRQGIRRPRREWPVADCVLRVSVQEAHRADGGHIRDSSRGVETLL
jgi:hypothetical protein